MNNFESLDYEENFRNGYVIVEDTLFEIENSIVVDYWDLSGETIEEKVKDAREQADIDESERIYYDSEGCYSELVIMDEGRLVSAFDIQMSEDEESLVEHFMDM